jgi:hypothetical protein
VRWPDFKRDAHLEPRIRQLMARIGTTHVKLAEHGVRGNGHMMILELNNMEIVAVVGQWLEDAMVVKAILAAVEPLNAPA